MNDMETIEKEQKKTCEQFGVRFHGIDFGAKIGYALSTEGQFPINGLRHPPTNDTSGWYIWFGQNFSDDDNFFVPLHAFHLLERCPEILKFLGLPAGYRFLKASEYVDVWYDASLLDV
jgi:hypothetical protein